MSDTDAKFARLLNRILYIDAQFATIVSVFGRSFAEELLNAALAELGTLET